MIYACKNLQSYYQAAYGGLQGAQQQYAAVFGGGATAAGLTMATAPNSSGGLYPYFQYGPATAAGYSLAHQYPQLYQYAAAAGVGAATTAAAATTLNTVAGGLQQFAGAVAFTPNSIGQAG